MRGPAWFAAKKGRRDENHVPIRDGLRALGFVVADCAGSTDVLDLLAYTKRRRQAVWLEVKRSDGKGELTPAQVRFTGQLTARGLPWAVIESLDEALEALKEPT
jgi:hypothetical protein